jgi:hypothetical protein
VRRGLGLIALALLTGAIIPASSALGALSHRLAVDPGSIGIRIVDTPSNRLSDPLALSYIVNRVAPGKTIRRRIEISNTTPSTANVAVYPAAAGLRRTGFSFASGHARNEISKWTSVSRTVLRLPPGAKAFETVTIHVPKDASPGERYAVIWAEVSARGSSRGVTLANRVGIRMYVSVGPGGAPPTNFVIVSLAARRSASGQPLVVAKIQNKGRRTIAIVGSLTLSGGPGGVRAGPFPVKLGVPLGPGGSKSAGVLLDKRLPRGPWRARMQLRARLMQRVAVATITFPRR